MTRLRSGAGILLLAGALLLAGCGGSTPKGSSAPATSAGSSASATGDAITISNFTFIPASLTVSPGEVVKVTNKDSATHTLTATGGQFDTGDVTQNQTKSFTAPTKPGTYPYICSIHQYMTGTLVVK